MSFERASGILLHPTSLPGPYGIGEIGPAARKFVDTLAEMRQHLWQVLPLGPTSFGDSPYQSPSTFAGNHLLISFDLLVRQKLLAADDLAAFPRLPADRADYGALIPARMAVLRQVCRTFPRRASAARKQDFKRFCDKQADWLDDYALFMALKDRHDGRPWIMWEEPLVQRQPQALTAARRELRDAIRDVKVMQFLFHAQWDGLRKYCHERRIRIVGDIPIFVAHDSADVWAHPELYHVDEHGQLTVQAGVPPDYFSSTGQLWGNPIYRWDVHQQTGYAWWAARIRKALELVDIVRIDHFRGFEAYWEVPFPADTAKDGQWVQGPGLELFTAMAHQMGELPIIAEDLGVITPEVEKLREDCGFPGMRVLQFAFGNDPKALDYRPHNYPPNCAVYPGTHDNDTVVGWFNSQAGADSTRSQKEIDEERQTVLQYLGTDGHEIHWDMIGLALKSKANTAVYTLQDVLGLGSEARMNVPGRPGGNWAWRFAWSALTPEISTRLRAMTEKARRAGRAP